jgi:hypothetical protein
MYEYQQNQTYTAQMADGIEDLARDELLELGATDCRAASAMCISRLPMKSCTASSTVRA